MTITEKHFLSRANYELIPGGAPMPVRRFLVIHFTSGATAISSINFWRSLEANGASAHIVIDRDGKVYQCRAFNKTCGHAGKSKWRGFDGLNACSIGIELANAGDDASLAKRWSKLPLIKAAHKNGGSVQEWEAYPPAQIAALEEVAKALVAHYKLDDIIGHEDCSPSRKNDPGPAAEQWMVKLREVCGFKGAV